MLNSSAKQRFTNLSKPNISLKNNTFVADYEQTNTFDDKISCKALLTRDDATIQNIIARLDRIKEVDAPGEEFLVKLRMQRLNLQNKNCRVLTCQNIS
jgi:hypothetical protein